MSQVPAHLPVAPSKPALDRTVYGWSDFIGLAASIVCAIHCAILPLALAVLPSWGFSLLAHDSFHKWMFALCCIVAATSFIPGLLKHRRFYPIFLGAVGLICIGRGAFEPAAPVACECGSCSACSIETSLGAGVWKGANLQPQMVATNRNMRSQANRQGSFPEVQYACVLPVSLSETTLPADQTAAKTSVGSETANSNWSPSDWILTPLGCALLIVAHLLNHHFGVCCHRSLSDRD